MKKITFMLFITLTLITFTSLNFNVNAVYVIDNSTLIADINSLETELLNNDTTVINEMNSAIDIMENNDKLINILSAAKDIRDKYQDNYPFLPVNNYENQQVLVDGYICAALAYFWCRDLKLSFELLLQAYITTTDNTTYTPYYGYILGESGETNVFAHGTDVSGSGTFDINEDAKNSIHNYNFTKTSSTSTTLHITDVYDFSYEDNNPIVAMFGYFNELDILKTYSVTYDLIHDYSISYSQYSSTHHNKICSCGITTLEKHNFKRITNNTYSLLPNYVANQYKCSKCQYIKIEDGLI